jgi:hypothetical protein
MEEHEEYLGIVASMFMAKKWRGGYAILATTKRIVGVDWFKGSFKDNLALMRKFDPSAESKPGKEEIEEAIQALLKSKDFEIKKEEIGRIRLKKLGRFKPAHVKFLLRSGDEINVNIWPSGPQFFAAARAVFERVGELMQEFYPEALELED